MIDDCKCPRGVIGCDCDGAKPDKHDLIYLVIAAVLFLIMVILFHRWFPRISLIELAITAALSYGVVVLYVLVKKQ